MKLLGVEPGEHRRALYIDTFISIPWNGASVLYATLEPNESPRARAEPSHARRRLGDGQRDRHPSPAPARHGLTLGVGAGSGMAQLPPESRRSAWRPPSPPVPRAPARLPPHGRSPVGVGSSGFSPVPACPPLRGSPTLLRGQPPHRTSSGHGRAAPIMPIPSAHGAPDHDAPTREGCGSSGCPNRSGGEVGPSVNPVGRMGRGERECRGQTRDINLPAAQPRPPPAKLRNR